MHISLQIIIAALSVLGFCFCLKTLASLIFASKQIAAAVIIENGEDLKALDLLLADASDALFASWRRRLAVIVPAELWESCDEKERITAEERIRSFGAEIYIT